jgi:hypothetical protein
METPRLVFKIILKNKRDFQLKLNQKWRICNNDDEIF